MVEQGNHPSQIYLQQIIGYCEILGNETAVTKAKHASLMTQDNTEMSLEGAKHATEAEVCDVNLYRHCDEIFTKLNTLQIEGLSRRPAIVRLLQ
ncbi:hypothetical protein ElyMa_000527500 [Elysia marginata]|uniref:Uncharacterized protein n=1 Tax=Elysia marginata TaxID=1093978 RepID=A0AAV4FYE6_9GAST|nr:hypothetical protein ElyMa_000527500 [Elysia marginata]